jgi:hypothetical protein
MFFGADVPAQARELISPFALEKGRIFNKYTFRNRQ